MDRYNIHIPQDLIDKMKVDMKASGIDNMSGFIRMALRQFPFRDGKQWSDTDMIGFALFHSRQPEDPAVLETPEKRVHRILEKFKTRH